ncbi:MAG: RHS repeat-associated core domain-containing protein [Polaribacter sp.]
MKNKNAAVAITAKTDYYPFGMPMPGRQIVGGQPYRYAFQGQEKDPETGKEAFQLRLWDSRIGRWLSPDPYGQYSSPYIGMGNNPIRNIDPDGGLCVDGEGNSIPCPDGYGAFSGPTTDTGVFENGKFVGYGLDEISLTFQTTPKAPPVPSDWTYNPNKLDPSTIRQNLFGLSYPGGNNPTTYAGDADYTFIPDDFSEYPAIGHDRRYDNLNVAGASGLFTDSRAIGADWKFVSEELDIASNPFFSPKTRIYSGILGVGLGLSALPKTIVALNPTSGQGIGYIMVWYNISNHGVTNAPDKK